MSKTNIPVHKILLDLEALHGNYVFDGFLVWFDEAHERSDNIGRYNKILSRVKESETGA